MNKYFKDDVIIRLIFLLLTISFLGVLLLRIILVFSYIPETGGVSINVLFGVVRLMNGHPLYTDPQIPPYSIIQYMPLHYYIIAGVGKLIGIQQNIHAIYVLNRLVCLLYDLILFIPIYCTLHKIFAISNWKIIFAVYFGIFLILPNMHYGRVDNLYLLMFCWAVYFFLQFSSPINSPSLRTIFFAALFTSFSLFTKQNGYFLLTGIFFFLLLMNNKKVLLQFVLSLMVCCILLTLLLIGTRYHEFYLNVVQGLNNGIGLKWFQHVFIESFFRNMYLFLAGGLALSFVFFLYPRNQQEKLIGFLSLVIFVFAFITSFKNGSGINYFTEFQILSFIIAAVYFKDASLQPIAKWFLFFLLPFFILNVYNDKGWTYIKLLKKSKEIYIQTAAVANYITPKLKNDEYVFTAFHRENALNLMLGEKALFPTREIIHYLYPRKVFNYSDYGNQAVNGKIKYLVGQNGLQPDKFLFVDFSNYTKQTTIGNFDIYCFKKD